MNASARGIIVCSRSANCAYCHRTHSKLCDAPLDKGGTCDTPLCAIHTWSPEPGKDYCRTHHAKIVEPAIKAKIKAEREANKRSTLIFIAHSRYPGLCRDKDCGARWERDDPCYWDTETREVFCEACGEQMQ